MWRNLGPGPKGKHNIRPEHLTWEERGMEQTSGSCSLYRGKKPRKFACVQLVSLPRLLLQSPSMGLEESYCICPLQALAALLDVSIWGIFLDFTLAGNCFCYTWSCFVRGISTVSFSCGVTRAYFSRSAEKTKSLPSSPQQNPPGRQLLQISGIAKQQLQMLHSTLHFYVY